VDAGSFEELGNQGAAELDNLNNTMKSPSPTSGSLEAELPAVPEEQTHADYHELIYAKGTWKRIYGELYKVIDSSYVILQVLDARDPLGTICESVLEYVRKEKSHKQVVLVIRFGTKLGYSTVRNTPHPSIPTIVFHASVSHSFGTGSLIQLLRLFSHP